MLLPLFFFLLLNLNLNLSSSSISFPDFQIIHVLQPPLSVTGTIPDFNQTHFADESNKYTLRLLHRDRFPSVTYRNHHHRLHARMRRDTERVAAILRRISGKTVAFNLKYEVDDFGSDVVSGMDQGSGEYFVRIGVGSPPRDQYMVIDSGSDMVWVQCQPCKLCSSDSGTELCSSEPLGYWVSLVGQGRFLVKVIIFAVCISPQSLLLRLARKLSHLHLHLRHLSLAFDFCI